MLKQYIDLNLNAVAEILHIKWIQKTKQVPNIADFWPINNFWSIIMSKTSRKSIQTLSQLKKEIIKAWCVIKICARG